MLHSARVALALVLVACGCTAALPAGEDVGESGGDSGDNGSGSASDDGTADGPGGNGSGEADAADSEGSGGTGGSESGGPGDSGDTTGGNATGSDDETETEESGGLTDGSGLPFDCDDGDLPVRVEGGGSYDTIAAGVEAAPPDGVVVVCPGAYEDNVSIERSVTIRGAGSELVTVDGGDATIFSALSPDVVFLRLEGMTLQDGTRGVAVSWTHDSTGDPTLELDDLHITGTSGLGVQVESNGYYGTVDMVDTVIDFTEGGSTTSGPLVGGAVSLYRVTATVTDCTIENNTAEAGAGLTIRGADVTVIGGRVASNTAEVGGGAVLYTSGFPGTAVPGTLTIQNSDWGAGAANENQATDVYCAGADDEAGFLGADATADCSSDGSPCCL